VDPVLGALTSPDAVLKRDDANNFSPYVYGEADAINNADPSGLMVMGPALTDGDGGWYSHGSVDARWEDSHPFSDYFLPWKPVADQRSYVPVVPAYQPIGTPYNPITGDPVRGHRGLNERTPYPDGWEETQINTMFISVDILTLGSATPELGAAAAARAAAKAAAGDAAAATERRAAEKAVEDIAEKAAVNGETTATKLGRQMHASWDYGPGFQKEFTLRAGGRVDAINFDTREVLELKPNNPRQITLGNKQLAGYIAKLNEQFPGKPWTGRVVTYDK